MTHQYSFKYHNLDFIQIVLNSSFDFFKHNDSNRSFRLQNISSDIYSRVLLSTRPYQALKHSNKHTDLHRASAPILPLEVHQLVICLQHRKHPLPEVNISKLKQILIQSITTMKIAFTNSVFQKSDNDHRR